LFHWAVVRVPVALILLIGKCVFLALLYLFIYVLFRQMFAEMRPAGGAQHVAVREAPPQRERLAPPKVGEPPRAAPRPGLVVVRSYSPQALPEGLVLHLGPVTTIGRAEDNSLRLADRFVSSRHAVIRRTDGGFQVRDEGSTNGTFVNGQRLLGELALQDGDEVEIGATVLQFCEDTDSLPP
jgi:hypothetical protein